MSSIELRVALLSGEQIAIARPPQSTIGELREVAQKRFGKSLGKLVSAVGTLLLEPDTLLQAGVKENDVITGIVQDVAVAATRYAFAAIRPNGTVVSWGCRRHGGDCRAVQDHLQNVQQIQATDCAFAAILGDGSVVSWGHPDGGGNSSAVREDLHGVSYVQATSAAFAAIKVDGSVVTWGSPIDGGNCAAVRDQLRNVQCIQSSFGAFAALREDGRVVTWGDTLFGGRSDVPDELQGVLQVFGHEHGFVAVKALGRC
ncbi:unnamed protein product [Symbiodinium natans]|uniref:Ubiquitin-like domain-containing protein n=1 Tax=Symbiodinium natans TaxID=878477 RepID=A0A812PU80_9DINO|nr:unnamed protein product [Symbiodinium natans]